MKLLLSSSGKSLILIWFNFVNILLNRTTRLYDESWWGYIEPLLAGISGGRILEAGCGTGRWAERLAPMGFEVVLSDLSPNMLKKAREYAEGHGFAEGLGFEERDVCDLYGLQNGSFDMVISTGEPITMCSDPKKAIGEYCRVVRPGGYVLCDAGNRYRKAFDLFREMKGNQILNVLESGEYEGKEGLMHHLLGPGELRAAFEEQGMECCTLAGITPMFSFPPDAALKAALDDEQTSQAMVTIAREYAERPEIVSQSSRLLAVARKPLAM
jgi:ubiquinone/menaquinone biosynthesis C-methylase UbiE